MEKDVRYVRSAIEDLAFTIRSSMEFDKVGRRVCIEHDCTKGWEIRIIRGTEVRVMEIGMNTRSYAAVEKDDEGMALQIRTQAEDMPDGREPIFILLDLLVFRSELAKLPGNPRRFRNQPCRKWRLQGPCLWPQ